MGHPVTNDPRAVPDIVRKTLPDGKELIIRGVQPKDLVALADIYVKVYTAFDVGETWTQKSALQMLKDLDTRDHSVSVLAEVDGKIVGGAFADSKSWEGKRVMEAKEIFVDPEYQQRGIGTELAKERLHRAEVWHGVTEAELVTFADKGHARSWHESMGYKPTEGLQMMHGKVSVIKNNLSKASLGSEAKE